MTNPRHALTPLGLLALVLFGCASDGLRTRAFEMTGHDVELAWGITKFQEEPCSGQEIAGGEIGGAATFVGLGELALTMSSAWDIGHLLDDDAKRYEPTSPAAPENGPAAPVLGTDDYPYAFQYDPFTDACLEAGESVVSATGNLTFTAADGDELHALVTGGETYRLDFVLEGDGIETFAIVAFAGGTGRFSGATGSFVTHTIIRFDFDALRFVLDFAEVLPGGTVRF